MPTLTSTQTSQHQPNLINFAALDQLRFTKQVQHSRSSKITSVTLKFETPPEKLIMAQAPKSTTESKQETTEQDILTNKNVKRKEDDPNILSLTVEQDKLRNELRFINDKLKSVGIEIGLRTTAIEVHNGKTKKWMVGLDKYLLEYGVTQVAVWQVVDNDLEQFIVDLNDLHQMYEINADGIIDSTYGYCPKWWDSQHWNVTRMNMLV